MKNVLISDYKHEEIRVLAARRRQTLTEVIDDIITKYFTDNEIKPEKNNPSETEL